MNDTKPSTSLERLLELAQSHCRGNIGIERSTRNLCDAKKEQIQFMRQVLKLDISDD